MPKAFLALMLACLLVSCREDIRLPTPFPATPSQPPRLVTITPAPGTATITATATSMLTPTASPLATLEPPSLELSILGCDTSLDLAHQMGEVTNVYVSLSNIGQSAATNVCAVLSASDEGRPHPDKMACVLSLPSRTRVIFKLTVDTNFQQASLIQLRASSAEKVSTSMAGGSCKSIGAPKQQPGPFGVVEPIP